MSDAGLKGVPEPPGPLPAADDTPEQPSTSRQRRTPPPGRERKQDLKRALSRAALAFARQLKREFRALYEADPKAFRAVVQKAQARIFRLKPGPKADPKIAQAAHERVGGAAWQTLYPKYIDFYADMKSESTREYAESGFQRKVNAHLQRHRNPRLRRQLLRATAASKPTP